MIIFVMLMISASVLLWAWYELKYRKLLALARSLPTGMSTLPLLGHLHHLKLNREDCLHSIFKLLNTCTSKCSSTFCLWLGPLPVIFVQNPDDIKILVNTSKVCRASEYQMIKFAATKGLFSAPVHLWKITRKHLNPIFHLRNLEHFEQSFNKSSENLVHHISKQSGLYFDFWNSACGLFIHNILKITFGPDLKLEMSSDGIKNCLIGVEKFGVLAVERFYKIWLRFDFIFNRLYRKEIHELHKNFQDTMDIIGKELFMKKTADIKKTKEDYKIDTVYDVYQYLQSTYSEITEENMIDETKTFLTAGTETSAVSLCACLLHLARDPTVQENLYQEINGLVGDKSIPLTLHEVNKLVYLDQVIKESLRLSNTVPLILRETEEDVKISDCTLPAGTLIAINLMGLHHQSYLYTDPYKFNPDNFSPENTAKRPRYSFLPFAGGHKDCIGKQYAMVTLKFALVYILREYKVYTNMDKDISYVYKITLASKNGYHLKFEKR